MKTLTKQEAWLAVGRIVSRGEIGISNAIYRLFVHGKITLDTEMEMKRSFWINKPLDALSLPYPNNNIFWEFNESGRQARIALCEKLANESKNENSHQTLD